MTSGTGTIHVLVSGKEFYSLPFTSTAHRDKQQLMIYKALCDFKFHLFIVYNKQFPIINPVAGRDNNLPKWV